MGTDSHTHRLRGDAFDVATDQPVDAGPLVWSAARNLFVPRLLALDEMSDVATSGAIAGDQLIWSGSAWIPAFNRTTYSGLTMTNMPSAVVRKCYYRADGPFVDYWGDVVAGAATTGQITASLPVNCVDTGAITTIGVARALSSGGAFPRTTGAVEIIVGAFGQVLNFISTGNNQWAAAAPFVWKANDDLQWYIRYPWR